MSDVAEANLLLRQWSPADIAQVEAVSRDPEIIMWNPMTATASEFVANRSDWSDGTHASWAVVAAPDPAIVLGSVSLFRIDADQQGCEVGYWITPAHRRRGLATWALRAAADYGFQSLELHRIYLFHAVDNPASCRVALAAGFRLEGQHRLSYRCGDGRWHDEHSHARLEGDPPRCDIAQR